MKWFRSVSATRIGCFAGALLVTVFVAMLAPSGRAFAELPAWMREVVSASAIEAALFRLMDLPAGKALYPRPPQEAVGELTSLVKKSPKDAELHALRAQSEEQALRFDEAEADWKQYAADSPDAGAGNLQLASYYDRRVKAADEVGALMAVGAASAPGSERFVPAARQRSWHAFERILSVAHDQALPPETVVAAYRGWAARYPAEPSVRAALIQFLVDGKRFDEATAAIAEYRRAFPQDEVFPVKAAALVEYRRGSTDRALALYEGSYQPLWPAELVHSYFNLLGVTHRQRQMVADARARLLKNPDDLAAVTRVFYYWQQEGNLNAAADAFTAYRLSKEQRKAEWSAEELYTLATLLEQVRFYQEAARYYFALASAAGQLPSQAGAGQPEEVALGGLVRMLLTAPEQRIALGEGNLSIYSDIAQVDRGPGYWNGILSLWLNSSSPESEFHDEEQRAGPYFHRAKAAELLAVLDKKFPSNAGREGFHRELIAAYASYGDNAAVLREGGAFLKEFPAAPERVAVAMSMADAYGQTGDTAAEFALYDRVLVELAANAQGMPLSAEADRVASASGKKVTAAVGSEEAAADEGAAGDAGNDGVAPVAEKPDLNRAIDLSSAPAPGASPDLSTTYTQVLDRYVGRLTTTQKLPQALAVLRGELDRNPDDPLLYERLATFLEQNNFSTQQEEVYQRAIDRFKDASWYDKLARLYIRHQRQQDFERVTKQVVDAFHGNELSGYFRNVHQNWPQMYLQLNLYAHQRFPHELQFTRNLLNAYRAKGTRDPVAWEKLLREHWFEADDLRNELFDALSRTGKMDEEIASLQKLAPSADAGLQDPAATRELAQAYMWQSHFEQSAPLLGSLAQAYPAEVGLGDEAASVFRSLAYFDAAQTGRAVAVEKNLILAEPGNMNRLAVLGDFYGDRSSRGSDGSHALQAAAVYWRRMPLVHPGLQEGYLQSATVFWDYFEFDEALAQIAAARKKFGDPALFGYEAGAIYENKRECGSAVKEYVTAAVADAVATSAHARLVYLASRPWCGGEVDAATSRLASQTKTLAALKLRADVLSARKQPAAIGPLLDAAIAGATTEDQAASLGDFALEQQFPASYTRALERQIALAGDPVEKMETQYKLGDFYSGRQETASAQRVIEAVYLDNPKILGVVRRTVDFYWGNKLPERAIATLVEASRGATLEMSEQFVLEAATKANESGDYAGARDLAGPFLEKEPFDARLITVVADSYARAGDNASLRGFYTAKLAAVRGATLATQDRREKTVMLRRAFIPALTRMKDYPGATDQYLALLSLFPEDADLTQEAALYALRYDRRQQLLAFLTTAVTDSPRDSRFAIMLGQIDTVFEDYPGAIAAYDKAIAIRKDRAGIYTARADLEARLQRFDAAVADYDRLYVLSYKDPQWMLKSAEMFARQGKTADAVHALETAWIEGRPPSAQNYFNVAGKLESWNLLDEARGFAEQGAKQAGDDLLAARDNAEGASTYARILARQRRAPEALDLLKKALTAADVSPSSPRMIVQQVQQQGIASVSNEEWRKSLVERRKSQARSAFNDVLHQIGTVVAIYFTPEEKVAYARLLDTARAGAAPPDLAEVWIPAAQSAGLLDREADWRKEFLLSSSGKGSALAAGQLEPFNLLEKQRMQNAARTQTLEAYAATRPARDRAAILAVAADAWRDDGDHAAEMRVLGRMNLHGAGEAAQRERYFELLFRLAPKTLAEQASSASPELAEAAANVMVAKGSPPLAFAAVDAMARRRYAVWGSSMSALVGLYFAEGLTPEQRSRTDSRYRVALDDVPIGERLGKPADLTQHLSGEAWFPYGMRYGVYRAAVNSGDAEDFLASELERSPYETATYVELAQTYADGRKNEDALREYGHALELAPDSATIERDVAALEWAAGRREEAIAHWQRALDLLRALVDTKAVPESFWTDFGAVCGDLRSDKLDRPFQEATDGVLRAYLAKNGEYRSLELLRAAYAKDGMSGGDVARMLSVAGAARYPAVLLSQLEEQDWIPAELRGLVFRRELEVAQSAPPLIVGPPAKDSSQAEDAVASAGGDTPVDRVRARYLKYLLRQKEYAEARRVYGSAPAAALRRPELQQAALLLAAHEGNLEVLLAGYRAKPESAPPLDQLAAVANHLQRTDNKASRLLLEYIFERKREDHTLSGPDYLALAQVMLDAKDTRGAVELLHQMTLLGDDLYGNYDSAARLLEEHGEAAAAVPFLKTLAEGTPWNDEYRLRLAKAEMAMGQHDVELRSEFARIASSSADPYAQRAEAARSLKGMAGKGSLGSAELDLLASNARIEPAAVDHPYFVPARLAAAASAAGPQKARLLRDALAVSPRDSILLEVFRAEYALGNTDQAVTAGSLLVEPHTDYGSSLRNAGSPEVVGEQSLQGLDSDRQSQAGENDEGLQGYAALPAMLHGSQQKKEFALALAMAYEKTGEPLKALSYLKTAASLSTVDSQKQEIHQRFASLQARLDLEQANSSRRPLLHETLEQANLVRPRLRADSATRATVTP